MVTIANTNFSSNQRLAAILAVKTKEAMTKIANRLDLYVSPNKPFSSCPMKSANH